ncbi:unnamed protein product [Mytilus edulis]|uniref:DDE Tnp4 domain-containing protein n=1 Tax=Mytilus edulis TaxID=6550 RepID=A0A8S3R8B1_MYTED|nr:unnamed protein product [Mytilus edulis]
MLSVIFDVSVSIIKDEIHACIPIFEETYSRLIYWPSLDEWQDLQGGWGKLPFAVGAIDGTSTEIYRPITEPQEQYYSGYRQYHCIHTQVVISNEGRICYVECGFHGHQNDAQQYMLMRNIGQQLPFPDELFLLGDKIYPNRHLVLTAYTRQQIVRKPRNMQRKCRKLNRLITHYRVKVEHAIGELKKYKVMGTLWRHPRQRLTSVVTICAVFVCRRKDLFT